MFLLINYVYFFLLKNELAFETIYINESISMLVSAYKMNKINESALK